ncbi:hypothetical protein KI387_022692, partial [Taxus chinensis]
MVPSKDPSTLFMNPKPKIPGGDGYSHVHGGGEHCDKEKEDAFVAGRLVSGDGRVPLLAQKTVPLNGSNGEAWEDDGFGCNFLPVLVDEYPELLSQGVHDGGGEKHYV